MSLAVVAGISIGWFGLIFWVLAIVRSGARRTPPPPAHPRFRTRDGRGYSDLTVTAIRRIDVDLDAIDWDWKRSA